MAKEVAEKKIPDTTPDCIFYNFFVSYLRGDLVLRDCWHFTYSRQITFYGHKKIKP